MPIRRPTNNGQPGFTANFVLGLAIVVLAFFTVLANISLYTKTSGLSESDVSQRECIKNSFSDLTRALQIRADLAEREAAINKKVWMVYADAAGVVRKDPTKPLPPKQQAHYQRRLVHTLLEYKRVETEIQKERKDNSIPPFPSGECKK